MTTAEMTTVEMDAATLRLQFLERSQSLPKETIRDLKSWWREKLREAGREKIIPFPTERGERHGDKILPFLR